MGLAHRPGVGGLGSRLRLDEVGGEGTSRLRWHRTWRADPRLAALADRHYSRKTPGASQFAPPGRCLPLITAAGDAGWVTSWPLVEYTLHGLGDAWVCTLFRNESEHLSSELIVEALAATRSEWGEPPSGGTLTFVDASKVRHKRDPGRCFLRAGFKRLPQPTKDRGLVILHLALTDHPVAELPAHAQLRLMLPAPSKASPSTAPTQQFSQ